jgi:hypothetical protein
MRGPSRPLPSPRLLLRRSPAARDAGSLRAAPLSPVSGWFLFIDKMSNTLLLVWLHRAREGTWQVAGRGWPGGQSLRVGCSSWLPASGPLLACAGRNLAPFSAKGSDEREHGFTRGRGVLLDGRDDLGGGAGVGLNHEFTDTVGFVERKEVSAV